METLVKIEVTGETSPEYRLSIAVTNQTDKPLTTYEQQLPWAGWQSLVLIAVKTDPGGTVLERSLPVDDPGPSQIDIAPGQTLNGYIQLGKTFPQFEEALKVRDVVVFWSYQFAPIDKPRSCRDCGYVLFESMSRP